ncbi:LacI family DNA-binding transcriptional regulator [Terriglobus aquaticus]|uniref:LacI family DNA-binding transcriptional regulator n=1 Tax=Terriglobus aquaticus TaxID=940139 RepID=A0ABW9KJP5_9BACT|nr:LacI family DNA-binding transcriptional regulator [Terriglobus aquaticus]
MPQRKSGHVTLSDVARATGFSVSTVSITLSEAPLSANVAASTREKIRATAAKLGYHPDARARSLRKQSSGTVGVLAFDLSDPFCMPVVQGIQYGLQETAYLPLVMDAHTERNVFDHSLRLMLERRVDGVIVIASWTFDEASLLADIKKNAVPMLIIGRDLTHSGVTSYLLDNEEGGYLAMKHLLELGHRKIAVIRGPGEMFDSAPRWEGMQRAAAEAGVRLLPELTPQLPMLGSPGDAFEGGRTIVAELLKTKQTFTAVTAFDDMTALGVVRGLYEAGRSVPEDCSVVGFDDVLPALVATPPITTVRQPMREMGLQAVERMLSLLQKPAGTQRVGKFSSPPQLVLRASTARIAGRKRASH